MTLDIGVFLLDHPLRASGGRSERPVPTFAVSALSRMTPSSPGSAADHADPTADEPSLSHDAPRPRAIVNRIFAYNIMCTAVSAALRAMSRKGSIPRVGALHEPS